MQLELQLHALVENLLLAAPVGRRFERRLELSRAPERERRRARRRVLDARVERHRLGLLARRLGARLRLCRVARLTLLLLLLLLVCGCGCGRGRARAWIELDRHRCSRLLRGLLATSGRRGRHLHARRGRVGLALEQRRRDCKEARPNCVTSGRVEHMSRVACCVLRPTALLVDRRVVVGGRSSGGRSEELALLRAGALVLDARQSVCVGRRRHSGREQLGGRPHGARQSLGELVEEGFGLLVAASGRARRSQLAERTPGFRLAELAHEPLERIRRLVRRVGLHWRLLRLLRLLWLALLAVAGTHLLVRN